MGFKIDAVYFEILKLGVADSPCGVLNHTEAMETENSLAQTLDLCAFAPLRETDSSFHSPTPETEAQ
jgi:hypothetical protein